MNSGLEGLLQIKAKTRPASVYEVGVARWLLPWRDAFVLVGLVDSVPSYSESAVSLCEMLRWAGGCFESAGRVELTGHHVFGAHLQGDRLYLRATDRSEQRHLLSYRLDEGAAPAPLHDWAFDDARGPLAFTEPGWLLARHEEGDLYIWDVTGDTPVLLGTHTPEWPDGQTGFRGIDARGERAVLTGPGDYTGLLVLDLSDPSEIQVVGRHKGKFNDQDQVVQYADDRFAAYGTGNKVHAYAVRAPDAKRRIESLGGVAVPDRFRLAALHGDLLLVHGGQNAPEKAALLRLGDGKPDKLKNVRLPHRWGVGGVAVAEGHLLLAADGGVFAYEV